jgi:hypothetical protein
MIQDRGLKAKVLRYVVGKRWFPQMELDVLPRAATTQGFKPLTDIDVLAAIPDEFDGYRLLLADCKTKKNESPITRALWLRGLMDHLGATRGICLLSKDQIEPDHRYNAGQFSVVLLTDADFDSYAIATGARPDASESNLAKIELWERFFEVGKKYHALAQTIVFSASEYWMNRSDSEACRKTIAEVVKLRPELDPAKPEHIALVLDLAALFMHSLTRMMTKVFAGYLQPNSRDELSEALLTLLYGGRENYEHLTSLKKLIAVSNPGVQNGKLTLPDWDRFIQLVRHGLDNTAELPHASLLLREVAWSYLADEQHLAFATLLSGEKRQAAKMALLGAEYISHAAKLPPEFGTLTTKILLGLQQPANQPVPTKRVTAD